MLREWNKRTNTLWLSISHEKTHFKLYSIQYTVYVIYIYIIYIYCCMIHFHSVPPGHMPILLIFVCSVLDHVRSQIPCIPYGSTTAVSSRSRGSTLSKHQRVSLFFTYSTNVHATYSANMFRLTESNVQAHKRK